MSRMSRSWGCDIRYWGDTDSSELIAEGKAAYDRELAAYQQGGGTGPLPPASYLAISGGGENGAFGAGLVVGWTETGTRPQFKLVTGISTGAHGRRSPSLARATTRSSGQFTHRFPLGKF